MDTLRGVVVGAGYFSRFHLDAWARLPGARITAVCDPDAPAATRAARAHGVGQTYTDAAAMLDAEKPDFVDIVTPPATHAALVALAAERGLPVICQKPLAPTLAQAQAIVATAQDAGIRFMVHENWRFQPWHREIKRLIDAGAIGERLHSLGFRSRMGDGWGDDAYRARQPYFRDMERLLVHETGVHFIDTFRYLAGPIDGVYADLRRLNPVIRGEDAGMVHFEFASGARGLWDANRYNEPAADDPQDARYTFGSFLVEGSGGSLRLDDTGRITVKPLGRPARAHAYTHERVGFAGDCVHATQAHFLDALRTGAPFETAGADYLQTLRVQEAVYESARRRQPVRGLTGAPPCG